MRVAAVLFGSGTAIAAPLPAHQSYSISEFDTIRLEAPLDVTVATDRGVSASATGDRDVLDRISLQMNARTLVIRLRDGSRSEDGRGRLPTRLTLGTNLLQHAILMGSGTLAVDRMKGAKVDVLLNGSGRLTIPRIEADRVDVGLSGSGMMVLAGAVPDAVVRMTGSGRLDASALTVRRLKADMEGSADAQLAASETATASATGTGRIVIDGKAVCTVRKIGSASITCSGEVF